MRPMSKQSQQYDDLVITRKLKVYDLKDLSIKLLHNYRHMMFRSDIGGYYNFSILEGCMARVIKSSEIGNILHIPNVDAQYRQTHKLVQVQFENIMQLSNKIIKILDTHKTKDSSQGQLRHKNIHTNYFLKYYHYKSDRDMGCYVFHENVSITLDGLIKEGNLTYNDKIYIFYQMLDVMQFLQELKICHRCITSYSFVFVPMDPKRQQTDKGWNRYDYLMKITGFYQSVSLSDESAQQQSIVFENNYTDPNIFEFKTPQFASDLWSVLILFFEVLLGKVPLVHKPTQLEQQMKQLVPWQSDIFKYYFSRGTKKTNITLKDLRMRVNQMSLTSGVTSKILKEKQQQEKKQKNQANITIRERVEQLDGKRKRAQSGIIRLN